MIPYEISLVIRGQRALKLQHCWPWHWCSMSWNRGPEDPSRWQVGREEPYGLLEDMEEETGSETLSDCLRSHSKCGGPGALDSQLRACSIRSFVPIHWVKMRSWHSEFTACRHIASGQHGIVVCLCEYMWRWYVLMEFSILREVKKTMTKNFIAGAVGNSCPNPQAVPQSSGN